MISHGQIVSEIERQLEHAKGTSDKQAVREALSAIRSLCEVVLSDQGQPAGKTAAVPPKRAVQTLEGSLLEEDDANGGSLFEF